MDKIRMVAALVVMLGHLLHSMGSTTGFLIGSHLDKILSSGSFAVVVFFGLSGIALRFQTDNYGLRGRWLISRFIRLMPVYWLTLIPPIIGCYILGVQITYPVFGFAIATLGLQSISRNLAVPPVNGPLWSLSVELYLSASLLLIGRWKRISGFYILISLFAANLFLPGNAILQGLPIFLFGYLLPGFLEKLKNNALTRAALMLIPVAVLLLAPASVQNRYQTFVNFIICTILASLLITWSQFVCVTKESFFSKFSQRSYSLYAVHFPIILFINKIMFSQSESSSAGQVILSIVVIGSSTEFLYRYIEKPSIKFSRDYLKKHKL